MCRERGPFNCQLILAPAKRTIDAKTHPTTHLRFCRSASPLSPPISTMFGQEAAGFMTLLTRGWLASILPVVRLRPSAAATPPRPPSPPPPGTPLTAAFPNPIVLESPLRDFRISNLPPARPTVAGAIGTAFVPTEGFGVELGAIRAPAAGPAAAAPAAAADVDPAAVVAAAAPVPVAATAAAICICCNKLRLFAKCTPSPPPPPPFAAAAVAATAAAALVAAADGVPETKPGGRPWAKVCGMSS